MSCSRSVQRRSGVTAQIGRGRGRTECAFSLSPVALGGTVLPSDRQPRSGGFESGTRPGRSGGQTQCSLLLEPVSWRVGLPLSLCGEGSRGPGSQTGAQRVGEGGHQRAPSGRRKLRPPLPGQTRLQAAAAVAPAAVSRAGPRGSNDRACRVASPASPAPWKRTEPQRCRPARRWGSDPLAGSSRPRGRPQPSRPRYAPPWGLSPALSLGRCPWAAPSDLLGQSSTWGPGTSNITAPGRTC